MFYHGGFVAKTFATRSTFQEELGFPLVDLVLIMVFRIFPRIMIFQFRYFSFFSNVPLKSIW